MGTVVARILAVPSPWRNVVRAMSQTGGASLLSGLLSMLATKIVAVMLGPAQVATLSTLQQLRQAAVIGSTLTGQTALVQGASAASGRERRELLRTVSCLMAGATATVIALLLLFPGWAARQAGLAPSQEHLVLWLTWAVVLGSAYVFASALLNAAGAVGSLSLVQLAAPATMAILAYPASRYIAGGSEAWYPVLLAAASLVAILALCSALHRERRVLAGWFLGDGAWWSSSAAQRFFTISGSMFASGMFASWVLLAVRARILQSEGMTVGGQFDAAWAISMNQAGLILASMQTYYLPTMARASDPEHRSAHIERVLTVAAIAATALIVGLIALKPVVLTTLYSAQFSGASQYLRWTLPGDYLKITSWILSIPLIASANMRAFLGADLSAYTTFALSSLILSRWLPAAESASIAFVLMYAVHLICCGVCLWRSGDFRPRTSTLAVWAGGLALIGLASTAFWSQS